MFTGILIFISLRGSADLISRLKYVKEEVYGMALILHFLDLP